MARMAVMAAALLAGAAPAGPLDAAADLYGMRLGMTRPEAVARAPGPCTGLDDGAPRHLAAQCGPRALSAGFGGDGLAWWITASQDLTGTRLTLDAARGALIRRYGQPAELGRSTLVWLPSGSTADPRRCLSQAMLAVARADTQADAAPAAIDPGCLPVRSAILVDHAGHHGLIVELRDPRLR